MDIHAIRSSIKKSISQVTGIDLATISDSATFEGDLGLDSLSILEIAVGVESQFQFEATDEELTSIRSIEDAVNLVMRRKAAELMPTSGSA